MAVQYRVRFGSDEFFREMKAVWGKDDDRVGGLLMEQVEGMCRTLIYSPAYSRCGFIEDDLDDYVQETFLLLWPKYPGFMEDPLNDPDSDASDKFDPRQKYCWLEGLTFRAMQHVRDRRIGRKSNRKDAFGNTVRLIYEYKPDERDDEWKETPLTMVAAVGQDPDQNLVFNAALLEAFQDLFSLPNEPQTLITVCYVIVRSVVGTKLKGEEFAEYLNGRTVLEISREILQTLGENGFHPDLLSQLREILPQQTAVVSGLTASRIANRKNTILSVLRKNRTDKAGKDE